MADVNVKGASSKYQVGSLDTKGKAWYEIKAVDWKENFYTHPDGFTQCYMTMGPEDGRPIFLLHGGVDSRISWTNVAPILAGKGYRVYVVEHRGHGRSDAPEAERGYYIMEDYAADVVSLMDKLDIKAADFVGHSCGSLISQILAISYAERVKSITLIATGPIVKNFQGFRVDAVDDEFFRGWAACEIDDPEFAEATYQYVKQVPLRNWQLICHGIEHFDTRNKLDKITCPVQMIWGTEDGIFDMEDQNTLIKGLTNTSYTFIKLNGGSHSPFWDSKDNVQLVSKQILNFVESF